MPDMPNIPNTPSPMKAVGITAHLDVDHPDALLDLHLDKPTASERDLLVKVEAVSVNPVDTKVRSPKPNVADNTLNEPKILGYDAVGTVVETGEQCELFKVGDRVYYAGDITRGGSNSEYQLIDERIVGHAPKTLSNSEAAALPLTAITAWEGLFDRLDLQTNLQANNDPSKQGAVLIIGGAGGVGSIAIQLLKALTQHTIIATASNDSSSQWCLSLGADHIINHHGDLIAQTRALGFQWIDAIFCLNTTERHFDAMAELIKPQGKICSIVDSTEPVDFNKLKPKSAQFLWEFMFTRTMFKTEDMIEQHKLLNEVAKLVDEGRMKTTLSKTLSPINADTMKEAHRILESGKMVGKLVVEGWG